MLDNGITLNSSGDTTFNGEITIGASLAASISGSSSDAGAGAVGSASAAQSTANTANTAAVNAKNQFDAVNVLNRSNTALNNYMMTYRDNADYLFTSSENEKDRAMNVAIASLRGGQGGGRSPGFADIAIPILGKMLSNWSGSDSGSKLISTGIAKIFSFI
mgnify:CR=1 FL=1